MCSACKRLRPLGTSCPCRKRRYAPKASNPRAKGAYDWTWRKNRATAIRLQPFCSVCGTDQDLTGDHVLPLSRGGSNAVDNIRVLCRSCNSRRGNRG
ncbi:HNH endonuclease [Streptomyces sp. NPDC094153]|uniref:HNH endonuclease n=1 Tax=Streptomyces sp. NPDC094153 TaxID=3366058 RepID=UPI003820C3CF